MAELKRVVDGLWEDYKLQMDIRNRHQEIEAGFREKIDALFEKRDALRKERVRALCSATPALGWVAVGTPGLRHMWAALQDEVWKKIQKHRDAVRAAHKPFAENRAFSGQVRDLVKQGKADEARARCSQQTEELMEQYASDAAFRAEYNKLWDAAVDYKRPAATASEVSFLLFPLLSCVAAEHQQLSPGLGLPAEPPPRGRVGDCGGAGGRPPLRGQPVQQEGEAGREQAWCAFLPFFWPLLFCAFRAPIEIMMLGAEPAVATESASLASAAPAAKPATIPGLEDADKPKAKPKKEKKAAKAPPVELPQLDDTPFVPPVAVLEKRWAAACEKTCCWLLVSARGESTRVPMQCGPKCCGA